MDRVKAVIPGLKQILPADIDMNVAVDRTVTIRASLAEVERTVVISILLVVAVVAFFLRNGRAVLIPSVAVTVSLLGAVGVMFLLHFSSRQPFADGPDGGDRLSSSTTPSW